MLDEEGGDKTNESNSKKHSQRSQNHTPEFKQTMEVLLETTFALIWKCKAVPVASTLKIILENTVICKSVSIF